LRYLFLSIVAAVLLFLPTSPAGATDGDPGTAASLPPTTSSAVGPTSSAATATATATGGLSVNYQRQGHVAYSADGLGQNGGGGLIQADVPAGSTVEKAFLYGTYFSTTDPDLGQRTIDVDGTLVQTTKIAQVSFFLATTRADVTAQVAAKVGSGGGITNFAINNDPSLLDGVALVVVYSNPALPVGTVAVIDGGASQAGDTFFLNLAAPLDKTVAGFSATMSVGSGFSFQGGTPGHACGTGQFSIIDINSQRLTTCAGHYDDGVANNGGLITVGGVGDDTLNPPNPLGPGGNDDELYNIAPFLNQGDTVIRTDSSNPSQDDNFFLAVISITALAVVAPENCTDGIDNDGDGLIDAADPDCAPAPPVNRPPVVNAGTDVTGSEGSAISLDGTVSDPDGDPTTTGWTYAAVSGVDAGATCSFGNAASIDTTISCTDDGVYRVTLSADDGHATTSASATVTVSNANPQVVALLLSGATGTACTAGNSVGLSFSVMDAGSNDTESGTINWGDGTSRQSFSGSTFSGSHTYSAGSYTVTVTATDDDGGTGSVSSAAKAVSLLYATSGFLPPINANGTRSVFKIGSTIPVKLRVTDCNGVSVGTLKPDVDLKKIDSSPEANVNEVVSSSAADTGSDMRYDATSIPPQYIYNLSTKLSQFCPATMCANGNLTQGTYELKVSDATFAPVVVQLDLRTK